MEMKLFGVQEARLVLADIQDNRPRRRVPVVEAGDQRFVFMPASDGKSQYLTLVELDKKSPLWVALSKGTGVVLRTPDPVTAVNRLPSKDDDDDYPEAT